MVESQLCASHGGTITLKMYNLLSMKIHCCNKCIQFKVWMHKFINDLASLNWIVSRYREAHPVCVCYSGWISNSITFGIFTSRECNTFIMQRIQTCAKVPLALSLSVLMLHIPNFMWPKNHSAHTTFICA